MSRRRHLLLGHAPPRSRWFADVGAWASSAAIPVEFVRCVSLSELEQRARNVDEVTAVIVDGEAATGSIIASSSATGMPLIVVDDDARRWAGGSIASVLPRDFTPRHLVDVLDRLARIRVGGEHESPQRHFGPGHGRAVMVTGPGGTGASTVAAALAQGLAAHGDGPPVLLADLCRHADQAMLHDARVLIPGVPELVDASRTGAPVAEDLASLTFDVPQRGYRLLLGMRRPHQWVGMQPEAVERSLDALGSGGHVVADVEPEVEGEAETGSVDVEDRHRFARGLAVRADAIVVVTEATMKGVFAEVEIGGDLVRLGGRPERLIVAVNRPPRAGKPRSGLVSAVTSLLRDALDRDDVGTAVALPRIRPETAHRDGSALPGRFCRAVSDTVASRLAVIENRSVGSEVAGGPPSVTRAGVAP